MHDAPSKSDDRLLDDFLASASATIEELVTGALQQGRPMAEIAIILERSFDGQVRGGCGPRRSIAGRFGSDGRLSAEARRAVVDAVIGAGPQEIPAVLLVHAEGYIAAGVKKLSGGLVGVS
jgi:hypothetical protein